MIATGDYHRESWLAQVLPGGAATSDVTVPPGGQGPLGGLGLVPELVHLVERRRLRSLAPFSQGPFDRGKAAPEFRD